MVDSNSGNGNIASQAFAAAQEIRSPDDVIRMFEMGLEQIDSPIPATQIMTLASRGQQEASNAGISGAFLKAVMADGLPYLLDGSLSKQDMAEITGKVFNRLDGIEPAQEVIEEAGNMLNRQNIQDHDGATAMGIARAATLGSQAAQDLQAQASPVTTTAPQVLR